MGKLLVIKGADFRTNGIEFFNRMNAIPLFQENILPLGKCISFTGGIVGIASNNTRVASNKTTMPSGYSTIRFKPKSGFEIALALFNSNDSSVKKGTAANGEATVNGGFRWVSPNKEISFDLSDFDIFAFNVRYDDNTTEFTSNELTSYFDYIELY